MKAIEAVQAARQFNVQIKLCGDNLALDAPEAPPERVLDALRENKPQIVAILRASIRPAGDDVWLAAVGDAARLGYWVVPTKAGIPMLIGHAWSALTINSAGRLRSERDKAVPPVRLNSFNGGTRQSHRALPRTDQRRTKFRAGGDEGRRIMAHKCRNERERS